MKIPVNWLSEYVDLTGIPDERVSNALTMSGTENEIVKESSNFASVVVGEIKEIVAHPNADKLQVTKTDAGDKNGGILQIVCGAPNIEVGQKVPVALPGAVFGDFEIKETEIRGEKSSGMLCSESELGISDDHSGIMILDARAKVGDNLSSALNIGGTVLEAEITPNRGDCLSIIGVAREAAAVLGRKVKRTNFKVAEIKSKTKVQVEVKEKELCPRYIAKVVEGVKIGPSPKWMQDRLSAAGVRPINNVVDVTNYVMLEWGQPMHAFDAEKIQGKIIVRKAKTGEKHTTLDGTERELKTTDLVIADTQKAIALAGVMGGLNSEVTEKTTKVVLEAAVFNPVSTRKTAQRLALRSEASNRFEKGIPLTLPEIAIERAAGLLTEIPGGLKGQMPVVKPKAGDATDVLSKWNWVQHVGLRLSYLNRLMGLSISEEKTIDILTGLGFEAEKFDFKAEARKHVGKPYVLGASFKTHGDMAFDCSYLTDYIYSRIGKFIGYTSLAQYELGTPVKNSELAPGDILFVNGVMDKSVTDHYFIPNGKDGYEKKTVKPMKVGHNAIYIGDGRIIHARHFEYDTKNKGWKKAKKAEVVEESVETFTKNPEYLGARRYVQNPDDFLAIAVPWWRLDVSIEEDIVEEIGRMYGYDKLPSVLPGGQLPVFEENQGLKAVDRIKDVLLGAGFSEVYNYSFVSEEQIRETGGEPKKALKIANPINPEQEYMRLSLIPSLLADTLVNQGNFESFKIFETASIYIPGKGELPEERPVLSMLVRTAKKENGRAYFELKGAVELLAKKLGVEELEFLADEVPYLVRGQSATIYIAGKKAGVAGIVSDKIRHEMGIKSPVAVLEIDLASINENLKETNKYQTISRYPSSVRDINMLFSADTLAKEIRDCLEKLAIPELSSANIIDIFEGESLPAGKKSVTIRLTFVSYNKTLKDTEVSKYVSEIITALAKRLGAKERI